MSSKIYKILAILALLSLLVVPASLEAFSAAGAAAHGEPAAENEVYSGSFGISETGLYIIRLSDPSLASYTGGIRGLAATSPIATGERRLNAQSFASQAYVNYLSEKQSAFTAGMNSTLGRSVEVTYHYIGALNAVAVRVSHAEAVRLAGLPGVAGVYPDTIRTLDTDIGPEHIGAPAIWDGYTGPGVATRGERIVIGVIDSGINSQHPSFAATDGDGYVHTNPYGVGVFKGWCAANPGFCNAKLIAAYTFHTNGGSPEDTNGHGSHTASTAGGNVHLADFMVGGDNYQVEISGVAPRANIVAYKVCDPGCPSSSSVAAVNSAILNDMVDVLNYSISGSDSPWTDTVDLAFLDAFNAGIFVSASGGNSGPGPSTIAKTGPWNAAVAASTHKRVIGQTVDVTGPTTPAELQGMVAVPGQNTFIAANINGTLKYDAANNTGCTAFTPGTFTNALALIQRGGCSFIDKVNNAATAGATGVVIFNSVGGPPISMGSLTGTPPAVMIDLASGMALRDYVLANPTNTTIRINSQTSYVIDENWEDITAGFSSRGPSQFELLKPDYIAPGVNILAAYAAEPGDAAQYTFLQGTSMSSPHGAGAAALMVALQPTWGPAEIKSAIASTARGGMLADNGSDPAIPFDVGSGLINLVDASTTGLVLNETHANYVAANPAIGGDPKTLNQPSMVNYNCTGTCTWTRTVKSVLDAPADYTASFTGPAGMNITVTPANFTIAAGGTQALQITANVAALTPEQFHFGSVKLETDAVHDAPTGVASLATTFVADTNLPVVVFVKAAQPLFDIDPTSVTSLQDINEVVEKTLTISNLGAVDLEWEVTETSPLLSLPIRPAFHVPTAAATRVTIGDDLLTYSSLAASSPAAPTALDFSRYPVNITHSASLSILNANAVACSPDGGTTTSINSYLRTFVLEDFGIFGAFDVEQVSFGIENLSGSVNRDITVNLYTLNGTFTYANMTLIGTATASLAPQTLTVVEVPVTGTAPASATLVVEIAPPNLSGVASFYIGSNAAGQTAPSYIASSSCGITNPTSFASLSFPNVHIVMSVSGDAEPVGCDVPSGVAWADVSPLSGVVPGAGSQDVAVTFDSTGLAVGEYNADLCLETNDPLRPLAVVPLTLNVKAEPKILLNAASLLGKMAPDSQFQTVLEIHNIGVAPLNWEIQAAEGFDAGPPAPSVLVDAGDRANPSSTGVGLEQTVMPGLRAYTPRTSLSEGFDDITLLPGRGWVFDNKSSPVGSTGWFQGNAGSFAAHAGAPNSYIGANFNNTAGTGTISNWMLTPELTFRNGDTITFWTRRVNSAWVDRLEVRWSDNGASTDVGAAATDVGDFDALLLSINPDLLPGVYPTEWTQYTLTVSGLAGPTNGRVGFRYFVTDGGPSGANSDYIGIDTFEFNSTIQTLYSNGPLVTSYGDGPGGSDVSLLQNVSLGLSTLGFAANPPTFRFADQFTVDTPGGWKLDSLVFYAYQTGSTTVSTLTGVNFRIWDGPPNDPASTVLYGDTTTNRFMETGWTGIYRYSENAIGNTTRPIMYIIGEADVVLAPGTYWVDYQLSGSLASGPWQPPVTYIGETTTGDAMQLDAGVWAAAVDSAQGTAQGVPFQVRGTNVCSYLGDSPWLDLSATSGTTDPGGKTEVTVTMDTTGMAQDTYTAYLCIHSDDPQTPTVVVPVEMVVQTFYLYLPLITR